MRQLVLEASGDALTECLRKPLHLAPVDLRELLSRSVMILSAMAAELGIILQIRMAGSGLVINADPDKIHRFLVALMVHLLTISKPNSRALISLKSAGQNGDWGVSLVCISDNAVVPGWAASDRPFAWNSSAEIAACRQIIESHQGCFSILSTENGKVVYSIWLPSNENGKT